MKRTIHSILKESNSQKTVAERAQVLRDNDSPALRNVLQAALHPNVIWLLPEGVPPFRPNESAETNPTMLYREIRKLYLFVEAGGVEMHTIKRERLFIDLLETVMPEEAEVLIAAKDKTLPFKQIGPKVVELAFPGLLG